MLRALAETVVEGVATSIPADVAILEHPGLRGGDPLDRLGRTAPRPLGDREPVVPTPDGGTQNGAGRDGAGELREVTVEVDGRRYEVKVKLPEAPCPRAGQHQGSDGGGRRSQERGLAPSWCRCKERS